MNFAPTDLVSAHRWDRVTFTTYALSLSFFEAVVLDALIRGGARQALILADVQGVRASLSEQGAQRVGKDYNVEPVSVSSGRAFHPKISVFSDQDESHVLVGSGNLTFNGWGGNVEVLEHLHPSFAADAIADTAEFFELLPVTERVHFGAEDECAAIAADLRRSVQGKPANGNIRLLHNLDNRFRSSSCRWLTTSAARHGSLPPLPSGTRVPPSTNSARRWRWTIFLSIHMLTARLRVRQAPTGPLTVAARFIQSSWR